MSALALDLLLVAAVLLLAAFTMSLSLMVALLA